MTEIKCAQPAPEPAHATNCWTIISPRGAIFTGETPLRAANEANKHVRATDPAEAKKWADMMERLQAENEAENARMLAEHGTLNCPTCGGSGHIGDVEPSSQPVAWANFRHDPPSYVVFKTREQAQRSVDQSEISATQEGPYSVLPLYTSPVQALAVKAEPVAEPIRCPERVKNGGTCPHHNLHCGWPACNKETS